MVAARVFNQCMFSYFPHTDVSGDVWTKIKAGTATSNGAADGTTVIDSNGDSGGADTYNGLYWVRITSGACKGEEAMIVDDNGTGTLTVETAGPTSAAGFSAQIASGVSYEIWKSPDPVMVVDSSSGETDAVDAGRNDEVDDFWIGYYLIPVTGSRRGRIAQVTDYTQSTGTFVLASGLGGALASGDVCILRKFVEVGGLSVPGGEGYAPRLSPRTDFSLGDGVVTNRSGTLAFNAQITASGSLAASASKANASVLAHLLEAAGLEEVIGTSMTVDSGSSTTAIKVATGTGERVVPGQMVIWNGNPTFVDSIDDGGGSADTVNVTPALPGTPAASDVLYATRMYKKSRDAEIRAVGFDIEMDGVRTRVTGCKGSVSLQDGGVSLAAFSFNVDHWIRQALISPFIDRAGAAYTTVAPVKPMDRIAWLDSTKVDIAGLTTSPNSAVTPKTVQGSSGINGQSGFQLTGYNCGATFRQIMETANGLTQDARWRLRTAAKFRVVEGSHGNCFGVNIPVSRLVAVPNPQNGAGIMEAPNVLEAQDAGTATSNLTTSKVPDYAWHLS